MAFTYDPATVNEATIQMWRNAGLDPQPFNGSNFQNPTQAQMQPAGQIADQQNYYSNTYANSPSVQAPQVSGMPNQGQPANTLQQLSQATPQWVLDAQRAGSGGSGQNPNQPPTGAVPIPGAPGHYLTRTGSTWSMPGTGGGPGSEGSAARIQAALRAGGPEVQNYLNFQNANNIDTGYGNRDTNASYLRSIGQGGGGQQQPPPPAQIPPAQLPPTTQWPPPMVEAPQPDPRGTQQQPTNYAQPFVQPLYQGTNNGYNNPQDVYGRQFNVPQIPRAQLPQNPFGGGQYNVNVGGGQGQGSNAGYYPGQGGFGSQIGAAFGGQPGQMSPQQVQQALMQRIQSGQISPQQAQQAWGQFQQSTGQGGYGGQGNNAMQMQPYQPYQQLGAGGGQFALGYDPNRGYTPTGGQFPGGAEPWRLDGGQGGGQQQPGGQQAWGGGLGAWQQSQSQPTQQGWAAQAPQDMRAWVSAVSNWDRSNYSNPTSASNTQQPSGFTFNNNTPATQAAPQQPFNAAAPWANATTRRPEMPSFGNTTGQMRPQQGNPYGSQQWRGF